MKKTGTLLGAIDPALAQSYQNYKNTRQRHRVSEGMLGGLLIGMNGALGFIFTNAQNIVGTAAGMAMAITASVGTVLLGTAGVAIIALMPLGTVDQVKSDKDRVNANLNNFILKNRKNIRYWTNCYIKQGGSNTKQAQKLRELLTQKSAAVITINDTKNLQVLAQIRQAARKN